MRSYLVHAFAKFIDDVLTEYGKIADEAEVDIINNTTTMINDPLPIDSLTEVAGFGFTSTHSRREINAEAEDSA